MLQNILLKGEWRKGEQRGDGGRRGAEGGREGERGSGGGEDGGIEGRGKGEGRGALSINDHEHDFVKKQCQNQVVGSLELPLSLGGEHAWGRKPYEMTGHMT